MALACDIAADATEVFEGEDSLDGEFFKTAEITDAFDGVQHCVFLMGDDAEHHLAHQWYDVSLYVHAAKRRHPQARAYKPHTIAVSKAN